MFALISVPIAIGLAYIPIFTRGAILHKNKKYDNEDPRAVPSLGDEEKDKLMKDLGNCHNNQLETLGPYSAGIAAAAAVGVNACLLNSIATSYIASRGAYLVAYTSIKSGKGYPRTGAFAAAMTSIVWLWVAAAAKAAKSDDDE